MAIQTMVKKMKHLLILLLKPHFPRQLFIYIFQPAISSTLLGMAFATSFMISDG
jgi:hypothetical protein